MESLSPAAARRIALAAQGFANAPTGRPDGPAPTPARILATVRRLGLLQLDSVNVLCRAHYLPLLSRLGPYDTAVLDRLAAHTPDEHSPTRGRRLIEYWAHEASLVPVETHPLLRWRMADLSQAWGSIRRVATEQPDLLDAVRDRIDAHGPIRARDTGVPRAAAAPGEMWNWHSGKVALEHLFFRGEIGAARRVHFERRYDRIDRILPAAILDAPTPDRDAAQRELIRIAARALGVATEPDLGDYFRLPRADSRARVAELVQAGELVPAAVTGWREPAYLWPETRRPRRLSARALLSPFDSLIFFRPRTERLFDFRYRLEIYTPASQRRFGYYVLPFLLGDRLLARVDLKADRAASTLQVLAAHREPDADPGYIAPELDVELARLAGWLGLVNGVRIHPRGDLAAHLTDQSRP